ncbi:MAG: repair protein RecN [Solirubrobacteraceae bacterium]|jgi:DNA repair protein RecN (Recombination protein N)|nr:repair protein RecN [Solirubrobacteraceae bacterium]
MLQELRVENLLLIERAELRLVGGLNVLTGETGAGKTVLAHALDLLLGGRARPGIVRPGAEEAYVEGVFDLSDQARDALGERLAADAEEIVLARRVGSDGRTRAYLNGRAATVADLRDIGGMLLTFYGQHEHRKLTLAAAQMQVLDDLCGPEQTLRLRSCAEALERSRGIEQRLEHLRELAGARERELDLLEHELAEIDSLAPRDGEQEALLAARERLRKLDALRSAADAAAEALAPEGADAQTSAQLMGEAVSRLDALAGVDARLDGLAERMRGLLIESQDLAAELRDYHGAAASHDLDGAGDIGEELTLDALEERLAMIERLARKHGGSVQAVLDHATAARARRTELLGAEVAIGQATEQLEEARSAVHELVAALRRARKAAADQLATGVRKQLAALAMGEASFEVRLAEREPGPSGGDAVEFSIAPNPGVPAGPLREIASGGELSRVMLAIMTVAGRSSAQATLVFDEVDAGIGGHTARAVGARLRDLAERTQVLCITHLPQIASLGDRHFSIAKDTGADPTRATVVQLAEPEVVSELVRMLGADDDDTTARRHARGLRRAA